MRAIYLSRIGEQGNNSHKQSNIYTMERTTSESELFKQSTSLI